MNDLARLLSEARAGRPFRRIHRQAKGEFSLQSMINYERGINLPRREKLAVLARCYGRPRDEIQGAYERALLQAAQAPLQERPFLTALGDASKGDHLVIITQNSLIAEHSHLADELLRLVEDRGLFFTYVAYMPDLRPAANPPTPLWSHNHSKVAWMIRDQAVSLGRPDLASQVNYIVLTEPTEIDFYFLRGDGATSYLRRAVRGKDRSLSDSRVWSEMKAPDGKPWWYPRGQSFLEAVNYWLVDECALELPSPTLSKRSRAAKAGTLQLLTLDKLLARYGG